MEELHDIERGGGEDEGETPVADHITSDTPAAQEHHEMIQNHYNSWIDFFLPRSARQGTEDCLIDCCCCRDECWNARIRQMDANGSYYYDTVGHCVLVISCSIATAIVIVGLLLLIIWLTVGFEE